MTDNERNRIEAICKVANVTDIEDLSDGFHTFNQLYYQRMMLFATIVKQNKERAWKSLRHEDGELCFGGGWFIVGIDTPEGSYTYHYEDNYFSLFDCVELERAKHWDGHTEKDVTRLLSLPDADIIYLQKKQAYIQGWKDAEASAQKLGDIISRTDVIEVLRKLQKKEHMPDATIVTLESAKSIISLLRPAQPEITLESAIDYLHKIGWMQEHDRVLTESAQPEPQWIPCAPDTMPDELEEVYVTWVNHNPPWYYIENKDKPFTALAVYHRGKWYWYSSICVDMLAEYGKNDVDKVDKDIEIVAWKPMPEPYREENEK